MDQVAVAAHLLGCRQPLLLFIQLKRSTPHSTGAGLPVSHSCPSPNCETSTTPRLGWAADSHSCSSSSCYRSTAVLLFNRPLSSSRCYRSTAGLLCLRPRPPLQGNRGEQLRGPSGTLHGPPCGSCGNRVLNGKNRPREGPQEQRRIA